MIEVWHCQGCRDEGYSRSAAGAGHATGLRAIGWFVEINQEGVVQILCPSCHPRGFAGAVEQSDTITKGPILSDPRWTEVPAVHAEETRENNARLDAIEKRLAPLWSGDPPGATTHATPKKPRPRRKK